MDPTNRLGSGVDVLDAPPESSFPSQPSGATVYIVDDDATVLASVAALVDSMGIAYAAHSCAEEFLENWNREAGGCLVTDWRMRGLSGLDLLERLAAESTTIPVIVITAFADVPMAVKAMRSGALTLLQKPCREQELWEAIRQALQLDKSRRESMSHRDQIRQRLEQLTPGEREVMNLAVAGKANKVIAQQLDIGLRTVEKRRHYIFRKMQVDSLPELVQLIMFLNGTSPQDGTTPLGGSPPEEE
ncbi:two component transcriptional regulator, LuxR family [Pirellula staleyi DSM 6068]|uniref:Two component transcriptional regulator, LuxR family n=1 Tax=Pirellula staleyi (strain ATCC 27377 / DSM 6068 / ICPB 4128) TaxID=530564 RepID=D2R104_PIRSD|nr:response regulator [Pirellula staleyi]ADB18489.1 two component transcriptional regulator, LuxR family [Pirellula staleyi DSM 6068]